jgi:hypothetical protein
MSTDGRQGKEKEHNTKSQVIRIHEQQQQQHQKAVTIVASVINRFNVS